MSLSTFLQLATMVVIGGPLWYAVIRYVVVFKEYPPHRHINGKLEYPRGFEPPVVRSLDGH